MADVLAGKLRVNGEALFSGPVVFDSDQVAFGGRCKLSMKGDVDVERSLAVALYKQCSGTFRCEHVEEFAVNASGFVDLQGAAVAVSAPRITVSGSTSLELADREHVVVRRSGCTVLTLTDHTRLSSRLVVDGAPVVLTSRSVGSDGGACLMFVNANTSQTLASMRVSNEECDANAKGLPHVRLETEGVCTMFGPSESMTALSVMKADGTTLFRVDTDGCASVSRVRGLGPAPQHLDEAASKAYVDVCVHRATKEPKRRVFYAGVGRNDFTSAIPDVVVVIPGIITTFEDASVQIHLPQSAPDGQQIRVINCDTTDIPVMVVGISASMRIQRDASHVFVWIRKINRWIAT